MGALHGFLSFPQRTKGYVYVEPDRIAGVATRKKGVEPLAPRVHAHHELPKPVLQTAPDQCRYYAHGGAARLTGRFLAPPGHDAAVCYGPHGIRTRRTLLHFGLLQRSASSGGPNAGTSLRA